MWKEKKKKIFNLPCYLTSKKKNNYKHVKPSAAVYILTNLCRFLVGETLKIRLQIFAVKTQFYYWINNALQLEVTNTAKTVAVLERIFVFLKLSSSMLTFTGLESIIFISEVRKSHRSFMTLKITCGATHVEHLNWRKKNLFWNFEKKLFNETCFNLLFCERYFLPTLETLWNLTL